MPTSKIFKSLARLDDEAALTEMLRPIRERELVKASLLKQESGRRQGYDKATRTARYIVSDGKVALCFTVTNVSLDQSAQIAAECDSITKWGLSTFRAAVERARRARSVSVN